MWKITDADYAHAKNVCKYFETKHLGEYHDLYVQSDTLLLADVFENFRNICIKDTNLETPAKFLSVPELVWQAALRKTKLKLDFLTDLNMLLMVGKGTRGVRCHSIYQYTKANSKYMKYYDKIKKSSYIQYRGVNDLHGWAMSQNFQ